MSNRLRLHLALAEPPCRIGGPGILVYVDEATVRLGAEPSAISLFGITDGRALTIKIVSNRKAATLLPIIEEAVEPGSIMISDGYHSYSRLAELGFEHRTVNHGRRMWTNDHRDHTVPVEMLWAQCRRLLNGRSGQIGSDDLWKFVSELVFRMRHSLDPETSYWRLISSFRPISAADIEAVRLYVDRRVNS